MHFDSDVDSDAVIAKPQTDVRNRNISLIAAMSAFSLLILREEESSGNRLYNLYGEKYPGYRGKVPKIQSIIYPKWYT